MTTKDFEELARLIGKGGDVDQEELAEALSYAGTAWYEIQMLTKNLCAGYRSLQKDLARKDRKLEAANAITTAVRAENSRLREELGKARRPESDLVEAVRTIIRECSDRQLCRKGDEVCPLFAWCNERGFTVECAPAEWPDPKEVNYGGY